MRGVCLLFIVAGSTGCAASFHSMIAKRASDMSGCASSEFHVQGAALVGAPSTASGCGRKFDCVVNMSGWGAYARYDAECKESAGSASRAAENTAIDRLALETDCPRDEIAVLKEADWSRGGERAYRMRACGKAYVCTTGPGRTDCEPAQ